MRKGSLAFLLLGALLCASCYGVTGQDEQQATGNLPNEALMLAAGGGTGNGDGYTGRLRPDEGTYVNRDPLPDGVPACSADQNASPRSKIEVTRQEILHQPNACSHEVFHREHGEIEFSLYLDLIVYGTMPYFKERSWERDGVKGVLRMVRWCYSEEPATRRTEVSVESYMVDGKYLLDGVKVMLYTPVRKDAEDWSTARYGWPWRTDGDWIVTRSGYGWASKTPDLLILKSSLFDLYTDPWRATCQNLKEGVRCSAPGKVVDHRRGDQVTPVTCSILDLTI